VTTRTKFERGNEVAGGPRACFITRCILESNRYPAHQHGSSSTSRPPPPRWRARESRTSLGGGRG